MFPCVAWGIITNKADGPDLLQSTRRSFKNMDLALSHEVNRQGIHNQFYFLVLMLLEYFISSLEIDLTFHGINHLHLDIVMCI